MTLDLQPTTGDRTGHPASGPVPAAPDARPPLVVPPAVTAPAATSSPARPGRARHDAVVGHVVHCVVDSPVGPLTLVAHDGILAGLYMDGHRHRPDAGLHGEADPGGFGAAVEQLDAYFAGELEAFDLPMALVGTGFQRSVWAELQAIPYGHTISYGELARRIGRPGASRAVGLANGRNPISIVVPCHRVIGSTGALTGYGGGTERKRLLLDHEQAMLAGRTPIGATPGGATPPCQRSLWSEIQPDRTVTPDG